MVDTLKQYDRLRESGFSDAQARARVAAMMKFDAAEARTENKTGFDKARAMDKAKAKAWTPKVPESWDSIDGIRSDFRKFVAFALVVFYTAIALMFFEG